MVIFSALSILKISEELGSAASIFLQLSIFFLGVFFVWKNNLKTTLKEIGFPGNIKNTVLYTIGGMIAIFIFLVIASVILMQLGLNDQQKVSDKVLALPRIFLIYAIIGAPITEELLFRAGIIPKVGVVGSSLVFGSMHILYGSIAEIVGATSIGYILAVVYKKSGSITPCILIHMIFNFISVMGMLYLNNELPF